jgi:hypothetical protein
VSIRNGLELIIEFAGKVCADLSGEGGEVLGKATEKLEYISGVLLSNHGGYIMDLN